MQESLLLNDERCRKVNSAGDEESDFSTVCRDCHTTKAVLLVGNCGNLDNFAHRGEAAAGATESHKNLTPAIFDFVHC